MVYDNKISDSEVLELIRKLQNGEGTEEESSQYMAKVSARFPNIANLIFWDNRDLTAEQILEEAKEVDKPIML